MKLVHPLLSLCSNMNEHELVRHTGSDSQGIISAMVAGKFLICCFLICKIKSLFPLRTILIIKWEDVAL